MFEVFIPGVYTRNGLDSSSLDTVLIAQLVEHCTSTAEVMVGVAFRPLRSPKDGELLGLE